MPPVDDQIEDAPAIAPDEQVTSQDMPQDQAPRAPIVPPPGAPTPAAPQTVQPLILRGPQGPAPVPSGPPIQPLSPEQAANNFMWRRLATQVADLPLAQTEQAVSAALRYQGQRQYQHDLASGMAPGEALAKAAPLLFSGPRQGSLGQAASFVRATAKPQPRFTDVGGILYRHNPDGSVTAVTPPKAPGPAKANQFDMAEYNSVLRQIQAVQKAAEADELGSPEFNDHQAQLRVLNNQLRSIRGRSETPTLPSRPAATGRVRVRRPDGRTGTIPASQLEIALKQGFTRIP